MEVYAEICDICTRVLAISRFKPQDFKMMVHVLHPVHE